MSKEKKWSELLSKTKDLSQPGMVKGILSPEDCQLLLDLLSSCVRKFALAGKPNNGLKIFIEQKQDNPQNERLLQNPPNDGEKLLDWQERFFQGIPFGMIMNFLENYSNELVEKIALEAVPLLERKGIPWAGLSTLFFMGDYGYTPFGVHRGSPGEDGFLFHLGPGTKTFYTWETEEYNRLTNNARVCAEAEDILHAATAHVLEPGDVISFPDDVYHVANTPEFSASLVLDYRRALRTTVKGSIIQELLEVNKDDRSLLTHNSSQSADLLGDLGFYKESKQAVERFRLKLKSNGGFYQPSERKPFSLDLMSNYELVEPFTIEVIPNDKKLILFARGIEMIFDKDQKLVDIIDRFNNGDSINIPEFNINLQEEGGLRTFDFFTRMGEVGVIRAR